MVLHGFTGSAEAMGGISTRLSSVHRVVAVDLIGHGKSPVPSTPAEAAMDVVVAAVDRVAHVLNMTPMRLVGYSMGGRVALSYAVAHPESVASLVLIGTSAGITDPEARERRRLADTELADSIGERGLEWFVDHWMRQPITQPGSARGRAAQPARRTQRMANDPDALRRVLLGLGTGVMPPLHDSLGRLDFPVPLVAGEADVTYRAAAHDLAAVIPGSEAFVVPDAGHAVHIDNPDGLEAVILPFLARVDEERSDSSELRASDLAEGGAR